MFSNATVSICHPLLTFKTQLLCISSVDWTQVWVLYVTQPVSSLCVCVFLSLTKGFALYLLNSTESTTWGKEWETLQKSLSGFYKVFSCWIPTDPGNIHHCLSTNNYKWLLSTFMVDFREFLSTSAFVSFSKQYIWITLGQGHESIHNLIQLCIRLGCKRWLPGEFKARMVGSYLVLSKEGKYTKLAIFFFFLSYD